MSCNCDECRARRESAERIRQIKRELPKPEWDWDDLQRQDEERRRREGRP